MPADQPVSALQLITLVIAVAGLVLGVVTTTVAVARALSDRVVVTVKGSLAMPFWGDRPGPTQYAIRAYNGGRRPVTIEAAGFDVASGETVPILRFPVTRLEDGQAVDAFMDIRELAAVHVSEHGPVTAAWFRDASGKVHRTRIRNTKLASWAGPSPRS